MILLIMSDLNIIRGRHSHNQISLIGNSIYQLNSATRLFILLLDLMILHKPRNIKLSLEDDKVTVALAYSLYINFQC
jgi:hypothetical protein